MNKPPRVADVLVVVGRPLNDNPFLAARSFDPSTGSGQPGYSLIGDHRAAALQAFQEGQAGQHTFWDTRNTNYVDGREIKSSDQVDWQ
ncbi:MAG: hypothetical protein B7Z37_28925 [Verrucomicrobia bacterium 12-59-8]|nr:MAG: hypothetical protein B7Z37_28925 [Verrucomicrobia bacterium 12-59-8]